MKKKRIELNQKLFLNKERIVSLDNHQQSELAGGGTGTVCFSGATSPCGVCVQTQAGCYVNVLTQPANLCNFAGSVEVSACTPGCNVAAVSLNDGMNGDQCVNISWAGGICR